MSKLADNAISVCNVSKCYQVFDDQRARLRHAVWPKSTYGMQEVWALKDINFEIKRGESFAVIGRNGSGKSTLLEIITQTLTPTTGTVKVNGRVAALLELGSGFNPDYTGRENVFLNGLLLGLTRTDVVNRFDKIAAFADIGDVLDRPVKMYSSGMLVRLAFAVQVALEPDILIVDEALSVGDYFFQQKCFGRLRQMREDGLTLLFVSHDMGTVRDLCKQAIYLRHGVAKFVGDTRSAVQHYFNEGTEPSVCPASEPVSNSVPDDRVDVDWSSICMNSFWSRTPADRERLVAIHILDKQELTIDHARIGDTIVVKVHYRSQADDVGTTVTMAIKNRYDQIIFVTTARRLGIENCDAVGAPYVIFLFEINLALEAGLYSFRVGVNKPTGYNKGLELDTTDWFGPFRIDWNYETETAPFLGMFGLSVSGSLVYPDGFKSLTT
jgi:lipopolysaccharide transport system ATP-binding protein